MQMKASDFLDYIKESKSKQTFKEYKSGLAKFVEWYGKTLDEILAERKQDLASENATQRKRFVREIEKFHKYLIDEGYGAHACSEIGFKWFLFPFWCSHLFLISIRNPSA
jgi:site-specific recombinase XerD